MTQTEILKSKIQKLYDENKEIYITVSLSRTRDSLKEQKAKITGVYKNIFQTEESGTNPPKRHTYQYTDILTGQVEIKEYADSEKESKE